MATNDDKITFLGTADEVIGIMANYGQVIQLGVELISMVVDALQPTPGQKTEMQVLQDVWNEVQGIMSELGAIEVEFRMQNLYDKATGVKSDIDVLKANCPSCDCTKCPPCYDCRNVDEPEFNHRALDFVNYAGADSDFAWYRPFVQDRVFSPGAIIAGPNINNPPIWLFSLGWYGNMPTPQPADTRQIESYTFVFDPQLTLLAYVKAIEWFLVVNTFFYGNEFSQFVNQYQGFLQQAADALQGYYDKCVGGLWKSDVPSVDDFFSYLVGYLNLCLPTEVRWPITHIECMAPTEGNDPLIPTKTGWAWNGVYGVVDIYGSYTTPVACPSAAPSHHIDVFNYYTFFTLNTQIANLTYEGQTAAWHNVYLWVRDRVTLAREARWKAIYLARGYNQAWSIIQKLRIITKQQNANAEPNDTNKNWSARELINILDIPTIAELDPESFRGHGYLLSDLIARLDRIPEPSNWLISTDDVSIYDLQQRPIGFRDRLAAASL